MQEPVPLCSNIEESRSPRPPGLLYPTPRPHQSQAPADRGFVHFEVMRHVRRAKALHSPKEGRTVNWLARTPSGASESSKRRERTRSSMRVRLHTHPRRISRATSRPAPPSRSTPAPSPAPTFVPLPCPESDVSAMRCRCVCISISSPESEDGAQNIRCKYNSQVFMVLQGGFSPLSTQGCSRFSGRKRSHASSAGIIRMRAKSVALSTSLLTCTCSLWA